MGPSSLRHAFLVAMLVAIGISSTRRAGADPSQSDKAAAETLFVDARKAFTEGRYQEACRALEQSQRLDPAFGTLLNLGRCYEKLGQTAGAWTAYREAASMAHNSGQRSREQSARHAADVLEPKLARLTIVISDTNVDGLEVRRDGSAVPSATWGSSVAVDPGEHRFEVSATGKKTWTGSVTLEPGKRATVTVPLLEAEPKSVSMAAPEASAPVYKSQQPSDAAPPVATKGGGKVQRIAGIALAGAGLVGAGVGGYFAWNAKQIYDNAACDKSTNQCTPQGLAERDRAYDRAALATGLLTGGAIALATGVVLWITAPSGPRVERAGASSSSPSFFVSAQPFAEGGLRSITVSGTFQ